MKNAVFPTVSVIIPTLNAGSEIGNLLHAIQAQNYPIKELIVIDSSSSDDTVEICRRIKGVQLIEIRRQDFDHGKTRDLALRQSTGQVVVFMTQDALPADIFFLERLIAPLSDEHVAVSTGRQLPKANATKMERMVRTFNYPAESSIRSADDIPRLGIKAYFCSDVCAAYNRRIYFELGGFDYPIKTNEDMFYAAKAIHAGFKIAYASDALVFHSHNFNLKQQYDRNYIQGYEIERHRALLGNVQQIGEGKRLVLYVSRELLKRGYFGSFLHFGIDCFARLLGSRNGRRAYKKQGRNI